MHVESRRGSCCCHKSYRRHRCFGTEDCLSFAWLSVAGFGEFKSFGDYFITNKRTNKQTNKQTNAEGDLEKKFPFKESRRTFITSWHVSLKCFRPKSLVFRLIVESFSWNGKITPFSHHHGSGISSEWKEPKYGEIGPFCTEQRLKIWLNNFGRKRIVFDSPNQGWTCLLPQKDRIGIQKTHQHNPSLKMIVKPKHDLEVI